MRTLRSFTLGIVCVALTIIVALPPQALAGCVVTASQATYTLTLPIGGRTFYLVVLSCDHGTCPFAEFLYEETNNIRGLQRHDAGHDDTCADPALADVQIW